MFIKKLIFWLIGKLPQVWEWIKKPISVAQGLVVFLTLFFVVTTWQSYQNHRRVEELNSQLIANNAFVKTQRNQVAQLQKERAIILDSLSIAIHQRQQLDSTNETLRTTIAHWSDADHYKFYNRLGTRRSAR